MNRSLVVIAALAALSPSLGHAQRARSIDIVRDCVPCHGEEGIAKDSEVPHLAGQNERYLYNQLKAFHMGKRGHKEMKVMSRHMTEAEMEAIAAFYAGLPPR